MTGSPGDKRSGALQLKGVLQRRTARGAAQTERWVLDRQGARRARGSTEGPLILKGPGARCDADQTLSARCSGPPTLCAASPRHPSLSRARGGREFQTRSGERAPRAVGGGAIFCSRSLLGRTIDGAPRVVHPRPKRRWTSRSDSAVCAADVNSARSKMEPVRARARVERVAHGGPATSCLHRRNNQPRGYIHALSLTVHNKHSPCVRWAREHIQSVTRPARWRGARPDVSSEVSKRRVI